MLRTKKFLAMVVLVLMLVSIVGCSSTPSNTDESSEPTTTTAATDSAAPAEKQTIEFWMLPVIDESKIQAMVDEFNAQSETTEVKLSVLPWTDGREQIKQAVASGSGPDVFYLGAGLDASLVDAGMLLPLDENGYTQEEIDQFSSMIDASIVDGHLYAAPVNYESYIMYYRTDILAEYGYNELPDTWEEVKEAAAKITEESNGEIMGFQFKGADDQLNAINLTWQNMLAEYDGSFIDADTGKSSEASEEGIAALNFMRSFYADGISDFGTSANTMFREGALAMYCFTNGPIVSEGFISDAELEGKWTVGAIGESGYLGGHAICGNAATEKAANAVEFIKWFTSPEQQPLWMTENYGIQPYNVDKLTDEQKASIEAVYEEDPEIWDALNKSAEKCDVELFAQSRYGYTARWDAQKRLLIAALNGETSVEDALKQIDTEVDQSL